MCGQLSRSEEILSAHEALVGLRDLVGASRGPKEVMPAQGVGTHILNGY